MGQGMMIDNDGYLMPDSEDDSDMEEKYVFNRIVNRGPGGFRIEFHFSFRARSIELN